MKKYKDKVISTEATCPNCLENPGELLSEKLLEA
jgi:hypothetical protein